VPSACRHRFSHSGLTSGGTKQGRVRFQTRVDWWFFKDPFRHRPLPPLS
jgi:hypothetical protein